MGLLISLHFHVQFFCLVGDIDGLPVGKNRGFDITCLPHMGEMEMVRDQIPTSAPPILYWGGGGLGIDRCRTWEPKMLTCKTLCPVSFNSVCPADIIMQLHKVDAGIMSHVS